jgi:hypothetical protein
LEILMSNRLAICLVVAACGCRKFPDGVDRAFVSELTKYADSTAGLCDDLLKKPCYDELDPSSAPKPTDPLVPGAERFRDDPRVRHFDASCRNVDRQPGAQLWCNSVIFSKVPSDRDERPGCRVASPSGWPEQALDSNDQQVPGDFLAVADQGTCSYPWVNLVLVRRTPGNNRLLVHLSLFPASYVQAHSDIAAAPPLARPQ